MLLVIKLLEPERTLPGTEGPQGPGLCLDITLVPQQSPAAAEIVKAATAEK